MIRIHLSALLGKKRWTQAKLAQVTGIRPSTISELYREMATRVTLDHFDLICAYKELLCHFPDHGLPRRLPGLDPAARQADIARLVFDIFRPHFKEDLVFLPVRQNDRHSGLVQGCLADDFRFSVLKKAVISSHTLIIFGQVPRVNQCPESASCSSIKKSRARTSGLSVFSCSSSRS